MTKSSVDISSEEATVLLTCLEYYILNDLQSKEKHWQGLLPDYDPIPYKMLQTLSELRTKLVPIVRDSK